MNTVWGCRKCAGGDNSQSFQAKDTRPTTTAVPSYGFPILYVPGACHTIVSDCFKFMVKKSWVGWLGPVWKREAT
ncbi:unnamed protein product [Clonostachys rosea f. rosea IK726]|uniref:Uncharacterized protein n=1 Tax=Clonostachys rosea f. rosea IK726 TaxID=1349383 RepID=A0ACA9TPP7_BIOOC|nr:unnamed protein product [Clonostachys rosea f. rosea IK726]